MNQALAQLSLTRIMVAHRPETINAAERVVMLKDGLAVEVRAEANPHVNIHVGKAEGEVLGACLVA